MVRLQAPFENRIELLRMKIKNLLETIESVLNAHYESLEAQEQSLEAHHGGDFDVKEICTTLQVYRIPDTTPIIVREIITTLAPRPTGHDTLTGLCSDFESS